MTSDASAQVRLTRWLAGPSGAILSLPMIAVGAGLVALALQFHGFIHGLLLGAALVMISLGAVVAGMSLSGTRQSGAAKGDSWLPSRDGNH